MLEEACDLLEVEGSALIVEAGEGFVLFVTDGAHLSAVGWVEEPFGLGLVCCGETIDSDMLHYLDQ